MFKIKFIVQMVVFASFHSIVDANIDAHKNYDPADGFRKVNEFLIKNLPFNEEPAENMRIVGEKYGSLFETKQSLWPIQKSAQLDLNFRDALRDLNHIRHLLNAPPNNRCTRYDKELMAEPAKHTLAHRFSSNPRAEFNRVQLITWKIALEHAKNCLNVWPKIFRLLYPGLDKQSVELAEGFQREALAKRPEMTNHQYMEWLINQEPLQSDTNYPLYAAQQVLIYSNRDPRNNNLNLMYEKYLQKPCESYVVADFSKSSLSQAEFDAVMFKNKGDYVLKEGDHTHFYQTLAYFRNCREIMNNYDFEVKTINIMREMRISKLKTSKFY